MASLVAFAGAGADCLYGSRRAGKGRDSIHREGGRSEAGERRDDAAGP
jgi:hypothetical protein